MRRLIRLISSNYRANVSKGIPFTRNSYPIWNDEWRYEVARYYIYNVFGVDIASN